MQKIKVMTIFGTRPEAIKMAPLIKELEQNKYIESIVCVTAQHREMLDQVLEIFKVKPDFDLDIMKQRQTLMEITSNALKGIDEIIKKVEPNIVLVHGDTSTTFVGSLASYYNKVKVGHVEAGLRTYDKYFPYPEEMNRRLTGVIADLHFAPTETNKKNLLKENIKESSIYVTGNTVIDALKTTVKADYMFKTKRLNNIDFKRKKVILLTAHRRENLGKPLENICIAVKSLVRNYPDIEVVYPVHLNPAVWEIALKILGDTPGIHLIKPIDVEELHNLIDKCYMVLTDSGGLQEEAPSLGKPVLVLRNETERPEAIEAGTVKLAGVEEEKIFSLASNIIEDSLEYEGMAKAVNPYGDGRASYRIVQGLLYEFGLINERTEDFKASDMRENIDKH